MKIAFQEKNCHKIQAGYWEDCEGCTFIQETPGCKTWPCDLIPGFKCAGLDLYVRTDELAEIFQL